jgi:hypothetical protein
MKVTRLGAFVDDAGRPTGDLGMDLSIEQYARLDDGSRIVLDDPRGFSSSPGYPLMRTTDPADRPPPLDAWLGATREGLAGQVNLCLLPDDDDDPEPRPWSHLVRLIADPGVTTTVEELKAVPREIVFSEQIELRLADAAQSGFR